MAVRSTNPKGDCYCSLWETKPEALREEGIPEGYCGFCSAEFKGVRCGKPGHIRQGNGPYSYCACDEHYSESSFNPISVGCTLFFWILVLGGGFLLVRFLIGLL